MSTTVMQVCDKCETAGVVYPFGFARLCRGCHDTAMQAVNQPARPEPARTVCGACGGGDKYCPYCGGRGTG